MGNKGDFLTGFSRGSQVVITDTNKWCKKKNTATCSYLHEVDLMLGTQGLHQLDVHGLVAVGSEDTQMSLAPDKGKRRKKEKKKNEANF